MRPSAYLSLLLASACVLSACQAATPETGLDGAPTPEPPPPIS